MGRCIFTLLNGTKHDSGIEPSFNALMRYVLINDRSDAGSAAKAFKLVYQNPSQPDICKRREFGRSLH
jgi:hypothetical protein